MAKSLPAKHILSTETGMDVSDSEVYAGINDGSGDYQLFYAPQWRDRLSSLRVAPNCTADVFNGSMTVTISEDIPEFDENFNDKTVGVSCSCN